MTRDEAARVLKAQADYYGKLFASMITAGDYSELRELEKRMEALEIGADALRGPQPDPKTGIVPCGCGGKPTFLYSYVARDDECYLECPRCEAKSALRLGEERARDSWNTAMGMRDSK